MNRDAGALVAALDMTVAAILARLPGYVPSIPDSIRQVQGGGPVASQEFAALVFSAFEILFIAVILEFAGRMIRSRFSAVLVAVLFFACATDPITARIAGL